VELRVSVFEKDTVPSVRRIKDRYVEDEHRVVRSNATAEKPEQSLARILYFGFHDLVKP
jgi:hypothetical protein